MKVKDYFIWHKRKKAKDCHIWRNRRKHLVYLNTNYWDDCARFGGEILLAELAKLIPHFRKLYRENEFKRDESCGKNCICERFV